ncbi:Gnk2-homologous domain [Dillenia turbinata]|uniref:Gnk2-homologous domain n=1 Tax=Dillenia turbinata TaxID=194707 RepID=A0AAN8UPP6_9MAGN
MKFSKGDSISSNGPMIYSMLLAIICVLVNQAIVTQADPLSHSCFSHDNYTKGSPFEQNLNRSLEYIVNDSVNSTTGFYQAFIGQGEDLACVSALCRADITPNDCASCIANASVEIRNRCPTSKGSIIWYDQCQLKYHHVNFFGFIDHDNRLNWTSNNCAASNDLSGFSATVHDLLNNMTTGARDSEKLYTESKITLNSTDVYGLVQCVGDLSLDDCTKCLQELIGDQTCAYVHSGGRVVDGSCNYRYESYSFINIQT